MFNGVLYGILGMLSLVCCIMVSCLVYYFKIDVCSGVCGVMCMYVLGVELGGLMCGGIMRWILGVVICFVVGWVSFCFLELFEFLNVVWLCIYIECVVLFVCEVESVDFGCEIC